MGSFPLDQLLKQGNISRIRFEQLEARTDTSLRDYQIANKAKIYSAWCDHRSVMLQMPTGTGKTRLFVSIVKDLHNWGARNKTAVKVLLLAHRKELIDQIDHNLGIDYGLAHGLIISQSIEQKKYPVQIGSVPTLNRRLAKWSDKEFDVIIIDEAHHVKAQSYKKILAEFPSAKILGVTATPYRLNGAGFRPEFDYLIISDPISQFIQRGYLSDYKYYSIKSQSKLQDDIDNMALSLDGDYLDSAMMSVMDTAEIRANIVNTYLKYARGKKGIVYTINKAHNTHIQHRFIEAGIKAETVDSDTPKEQRDEIVNRFRQGEIDILCNVNIFSEGFDCPDVEFIQLARPTRSLAMYLQQVGRGLRPAFGKDKLIILDNVGLYNRFGFPSARRKWQHHFEGQAVIEDDRRASFVESVEGEDNHIIYSIEEGNEAVHLLHDSQNEHEGTQSYIEEFYDYMLKTGVNTRTATQYKYIINNEIDHLIREFVDTKHKSIACCVDAELVTYIYNTLVNHKGFISINQKNNNKFATALLKYTEFTSQYTSMQPTLTVDDTPNTEQPAPKMENGAITEEIKELSEAIKGYEMLGIEAPKDWIEKLQSLKESISPEIQLSKLLLNIMQKYDLNELLNINFSSRDPQYFASVRHDIAQAINQASDELKSIEKIFATAKKAKLSLPEAVIRRKTLCEKTIENGNKQIAGIKEIEATVAKWIRSGQQLNIVIQNGEIEVSFRSEAQLEQRNVGRKEAFSFNLVKIPIGATITFIPTNIDVRVVSNKHIEYKGKTYTLSGFTVEFMPKHLQIASGAYQGPKFFSYKNERLTDRRERLGK